MDTGADLYDRDFVAWTERQAAQLRAVAATRPNLPVDWEHVAEEIEDLGRNTRRELWSRLRTIAEHLYKLRHSPAREPRAGWKQTVRRERSEVEALLSDNPSLRGRLGELLPLASEAAREIAGRNLVERGEGDEDAVLRHLSRTEFTRDEVLGDWFPEPPNSGT